MNAPLATLVAGSGPDLVLVHGWGMNSGVWEDIVPRLAPRYRVTCIDLPGHGASPRVVGDDLTTWARAVAAVAPERAIWLGWSLGGLIAMRVALAWPERVRELRLITATPRFVAGADWSCAVEGSVFEAFAAELARDGNAAWQRFLALAMRGSEDGRRRLRVLREHLSMRGEPQAEALRAGLRLLETVDLRGDLVRLDCPVTFIYGDRDTLVPLACADAIAALLPAAKRRVMRGVGHAPFLSDPDGFITTLDHG